MIPVTCDPEGKLDRVPLDELEEYQGNLKSLGKTEYAKLKQSITEKGFIVPCFAWRNGSPEHHANRKITITARCRATPCGTYKF